MFTHVHMHTCKRVSSNALLDLLVQRCPCTTARSSCTSHPHYLLPLTFSPLLPASSHLLTLATCFLSPSPGASSSTHGALEELQGEESSHQLSAASRLSPPLASRNLLSPPPLILSPSPPTTHSIPGDELILPPLIDIANHDDSLKLGVGWGDGQTHPADCLLLKTEEPVPSGSPVPSTYGCHSRTGSLLAFGFCTPTQQPTFSYRLAPDPTTPYARAKLAVLAAADVLGASGNAAFEVPSSPPEVSGELLQTLRLLALPEDVATELLEGCRVKDAMEHAGFGYPPSACCGRPMHAIPTPGIPTRAIPAYAIPCPCHPYPCHIYHIPTRAIPAHGPVPSSPFESMSRLPLPCACSCPVYHCCRHPHALTPHALIPHVLISRASNPPSPTPGHAL